METALSLDALASELRSVDTALHRVDHVGGAFLEGIAANQLPSAINLLHYLALRRHDLRDVQRSLAGHGLSSLGRTESHVRSGLDAVLYAVHLLAGQAWAPSGGARLSLEDGEALLALHTDELLGPPPADRGVRIMVTMPTEAATDYRLVHDLVAAGMDCMRVNCAHDGPAEWLSMITHMRRASADTGRPCSVCVDIAGPKLRTADIEPGPAVQRLKPRRDAWGRVVSPALVAILPAASPQRHQVRADAVITVDRAIETALAANDPVDFVDARGRHRTLRVSGRRDEALLATLDRGAYLVPGTVLHARDAAHTELCRVVETPVTEQPLVLHVGDTLILTHRDIPGQPAVRDDLDHVVVPAQIGVTLEQIFADVKPGEAVWFDDGRIGGVIRSVEPTRATVEITQARLGGEKLWGDKGINLPETNLRLDALTEKDREDLRFVVAHADLVGYSFVRRAEDVRQLQAELRALGGEHVGIILKIETQSAFEELPRLLLTCMRTGRFGVMIARGDLAIECGYERMAEVQEEILWIAEAAHTPVVWGTQVLESLAKTGVPSRAEVTDAAMAERAECVMLNKGPFIRQAVHTLDDILSRLLN